ncbi:MAG: Jag N-terminal domain-containing protein [Elusimicrobiales bacterium]|nr:Jag N-terminal domain-containing protein [Elusimicrobiales bacterium]
MRETKTEAKTIQDAVEKGLAEMGLRRDQVEVVVVSEGTKGFLGFGSKKACVILREKHWPGGRGGDEPRESRGPRRDGRGPRRDGRGGGPRRDGRGPAPSRDARPASSAAPRRPGRYGYEDARLPPQEEQPRQERGSSEGQYSENRRPREDRHRTERVYKEEPLSADYIALQPAQDPVEHARTALLKMLSLMGMQATVTEASLDQSENLLFIRFDCPDSAVFTDENGRGLQSLQFVLNSIVSRKREPHLALRLDTGGYWDSKEKEIADRVEQAVNDVRTNNRPSRLDPMPASMRKIVHNLIKTKYPDMETASEGEGRWRKVAIHKIERTQPAVQQAAQQPAEQPAQAPAEQPVPAPAEQPVQAPAEQPAEAAAQPEAQTTEQK